MNLQCNPALGLAYKAGSQIARVVSEDWCNRELYCAACTSDRLLPSKVNTPAIDFVCPACDQCFQLKSFKTWNQKKIPDAGYESMLRAIRSDRVPNLLVLQYSANWQVQNLLLVPRFFFSETVIERRPPLGPRARRAGWSAAIFFWIGSRRTEGYRLWLTVQLSRRSRFEGISRASES